MTWGELPGTGRERGCTETFFPLLDQGVLCLPRRCCVECQTPFLIFVVWSRSLEMGHTSFDVRLLGHRMPLLPPGFRCMLQFLGSCHLHPAYWYPLHLSRPSASEKASWTFRSPKAISLPWAGCSALCLPLCLPQSPGHMPSKFPKLA